MWRWLLLVLFASGCRHADCLPESGPLPPDPLRRPIAFRLLAAREVPQVPADSLSWYTRASQGVHPEVDFGREEVLRVTVRGCPGAHLQGVAEEYQERVISVDARSGCAAAATARQFDLAVPRETLPVVLEVARPAPKVKRCIPLDQAPELDRHPPAGSRPVAFRLLGQGRRGGPELQVFDRASDYQPPRGAKVDFERERVVRVTPRENTSFGLAWVVETPTEILVGVGVSYPCTAYPPPASPPFDLAIPLSAKPVDLAEFDEGPPCVMNGQG